MACVGAAPGRHATRSRARSWESRLADLRLVLRGSRTHTSSGATGRAREILDRALVMLTLRHVVTAGGRPVPRRPRAGAAAALLRELHRAFPARGAAAAADDETGPADELRTSPSAPPTASPCAGRGSPPATVAWCSSRPASSCIATASSIGLLARRLAAFADVVTLDIRGHGDSEGAFTLGRARAGRRGGGGGRSARPLTIAWAASASPSGATTWGWRRPCTGRSTPSPSWPRPATCSCSITTS